MLAYIQLSSKYLTKRRSHEKPDPSSDKPIFDICFAFGSRGCLNTFESYVYVISVIVDGSLIFRMYEDDPTDKEYGTPPSRCPGCWEIMTRAPTMSSVFPLLVRVFPLPNLCLWERWIHSLHPELFFFSMKMAVRRLESLPNLFFTNGGRASSPAMKSCTALKNFYHRFAACTCMEWQFLAQCFTFLATGKVTKRLWIGPCCNSIQNIRPQHQLVHVALH